MGKKVSVGLLGLGVVGSGVIQLIESNREKLKHKLGAELEVGRVLVRNIEKNRDIAIDSSVLTTNPDDVLNDETIDLVVEVMGGVDEAREHIAKALKAGKHVVTANKDLIAIHGPELHKIAEQNNCDLFYEASVGGGIPLLRSISDGLSADRIDQVVGIVNGTTNYILTKMNDEGASYEEALKEAQELGFAEADPTADVDGLDAARKMVILARLAFLTNVELDDVEVSGIANIPLADLQYGNDLGFTMKLIGAATRQGDSIEINVQPTLLDNDHPLASVKNEYNAVYVSGESVGETMFYGPGAGSLPTATAVMSDVVATVKNMLLGVTGQQFIEPQFEKTLTPEDEQYSQFYIRLHAKDEPGAFAKISGLFKSLGLSLKHIVQKPVNSSKVAEIILIVHKTSLDQFKEALQQLEELDVIANIESYYRVEGDA